MGKPSADEQEPRRRPTGWNELAQHSEIPSFSPGGKRGGWVAEVSVLIWGDLGRVGTTEKSAEVIVATEEPGAGRGPLKLRYRNTHADAKDRTQSDEPT